MNGQQVSVAEYFQTEYNYKLRFPNLPCLVTGRARKNPAYFPLECCTVLPGQRYARKTDEQQTAAMIKFTCQKPDVRARRIESGLQELEAEKCIQFKELGLSVDREMLRVEARVLDAPTLQYGESVSRPRPSVLASVNSFIFIFKTMAPQNGSWNLRDLRFQAGCTIQNWGVLIVADERDAPRRAVDEFVSALVNMAGRMGISVQDRNPPKVLARSDGSDLSSQLRRLSEDVERASGRPIEFVLCILRGQPHVYGAIKRITYTAMGIPSQCMLTKHLMGKNRSPSPQYLGNLLLKINAKLSGRNSILTREFEPKCFERPTMVIGVDVTHPTGRNNTAPSIVAAVGSLDRYLSVYTAVVKAQPARTEIGESIREMFRELLLRFMENTKRQMLPHRIVVFRDGVSEGQFYSVLDTELRALQSAWHDLKNTVPGVQAPEEVGTTFIVVQKRHHTRFFPGDRCPTDRSGNVVPGTVVDQKICDVHQFDFYLMSHSGIQGTSKYVILCLMSFIILMFFFRPTHYHVLHDTIGFTPDEVQTFCYNMCYVFARCTRSTSIVPAVFYAHLVAYRARYLSEDDLWSETGSSVGSDGRRGAPAEVAKLMKLHRNFEIIRPNFYV